MLAERLGADRRLSFVAGLFLALSPSFAHTTHQVLTDSTALALSIAALCLAARGQAAAAGLILAAAIATRETATIHLIAAAWLCGRRAWSVIAVCAVSVAAIVAISTPPSLNAWFSAMSSSVTTHPLALMDIGLACVWVLAAGPVPVVLGAIVLARRRASPPVYKVALPALMATAALLFYPDGSFSPRYMLAAVPLAFFIPAAIALTPHRTWLVVSLALPLLVAMFGAQQAKRVAAYGATLDVRISALPQGAVVVPGHFCPQARLAATVHDRSDLTFICPGWEWPADIDRVLDQALAGSSTVAIDASSEAWVGTRELPLRERVHAWLARHATRELAGFTVIGG
jgi:hypothetical protein